MNFFNEYGLLVAVSIPVIAIVGIQVFLFASGERGTLLVPGLGGFPSIDLARAEAVAMKPQAMPVATRAIAVSVPSNDEMEREAA